MILEKISNLYAYIKGPFLSKLLLILHSKRSLSLKLIINLNVLLFEFFTIIFIAFLIFVVFYYIFKIICYVCDYFGIDLLFLNTICNFLTKFLKFLLIKLVIFIHYTYIKFLLALEPVDKALLLLLLQLLDILDSWFFLIYLFCKLLLHKLQLILIQFIIIFIIF